MCMAEDRAREPGVEKPAQQAERPAEAPEYPLERDRSSLKSPGQEALEYMRRLQPIVLIPLANTFHIVEITT